MSSITARKLIADFHRKMNSLNTFQGKSFQVVDVVDILNEAWHIVFENNVKLAEVDSRYRNNLRQLEKKNIRLDVSSVNQKISFAKYPPDMHTRLGHYAYVKCTKLWCNDCKMIVPRISQSDDLQLNRLDPYRKADFQWEQLPIDDAGDGLYLYHDGQMEICDFYIDYYRKTNLMQAPSLIKCNVQEYLDWDDNRISIDTNFDVDSTYLYRKVVDVAVLSAARDIRDTESFQTQLSKILAIENIS